MKATLKPVGVFYQPPRKGWRCSECGEEITSVNKTGLCRSCAARQIGKKHGGWNKGLTFKGRDELK